MGRILNYTTEVPVDKTVGEIERLLSRHGVVSSHKSYSDGEVTALEFDVKTKYGIRSIRLPANIAAVHRILTAGKTEGVLKHYAANYREQAARVAWRIIKDWVEAQLAIIDTEMVSLDEVFLPYMITNSGQTFYQVIASKNLLIGTGEDKSSPG